MTTTREKLHKKALDLEKLIRIAKRKLLEFEILLSQKDYELKKFKVSSSIRN